MPIAWNGISTLVLTGTIDPNEFVAQFKALVEAGCKSVLLDFQEVGGLFPNINVPMAATVHYYKAQGIEVTYTDESKNPIIPSIINPIEDIASSRAVLSRVHQFDADSPQSVKISVDTIMDYVQREVEFATGSLESIVLCMNEIMDNVANHSGESVGFFEVQLHRKSKRLVICIADTGIGIRKSFTQRQRKNTGSDEEAIILAMEKFTRDAKTFAGNGLWMLNRLVRAGKGTLAVGSNKGLVEIKGEYPPHSSRQRFPIGNGDTVVDFQISYGQQIDINRAIGQLPEVDFSWKIYDQKMGKYVLRVASETRGYTRKAGAEMYNKTMNYLRVIPGYIEIDFSSIGLISASFADEFIGKLVRNLGFIQFNSLIRIINMEQPVAAQLERAVNERLNEQSEPKSVLRKG